MTEKTKNNSGSSKKTQRQHASERRRQIVAILLMVCGIIVALSVLSYSRRDEALLERLSTLDVFRFMYDADVRSRVAAIQNHLGLVGALLAKFFVISTVGFWSLIFPFLMVVWGWVMLFKKETPRPITMTNYSLVIALLVSATVGIGNLIIVNVGKEWSGLMGAFLAEVMTKLLGSVGASIIALTALFLTVVFAIDLDIHKTLERFASLWQWIRQHVSEARASMAEDAERSLAANGGVRINTAGDDSYGAEPEPSLSFRMESPPLEIREDNEEDVKIPGGKYLEGTETPLELKGRQPELVALEPADHLKAVENELEEIDYVFPSVELLDMPRQTDTIPEDELKANAELVRTKLANFGVEIESVSVTPGPVITLYELVPASGVKISRIVSLADDLALALAAKGIRIIAPIPGKSAVGVEIPNRNPSMVHLRSVVNSTKFREAKAQLPIALGKTIAGDVFVDDLTKMPHLLIAGSTGSGKSVGINTLLAGLLFRLHPSDVKFVIIDPKKIELTLYGKLKHHFLAVSPDINEEIITTPEGAIRVLKSTEIEMEKRYDRLAAAGVRNILDYNERFKAGRLKNTETIVHRKMPYLIVVVDELADLMMTAAREVEEPIARLAQLARAVGIHLVLATQRPSVDVITGVIKANFPARIAYQVASKTDSRTILDMNGAEQLLGTGDMLYLPSGSPKPMRMQNAFISTDEVERLTDHISRQQGYSKPFTLPSILEKKRAGARGASDDRDEFFEEAAHLIVRHQQGSVSLLQRRLKVGYSRAARLVDELEAAGIVGPFDGSKARDVLVETDEQLETILRSL
ncbi:MAG: DNA translocase FtsK 4TM domain-containing protein [Ignavibacteriae bacterium]|nr:DNA translocase FtsK 4TM domain-containing protein [Ignavibacteria bacterium]MBI3365251.1 DNA translocase FtsK 4TM domain-containing protein [Ignavibacteriota bacterium]